MTFVVLPAGSFEQRPIVAGQCSINRSGLALFHVADFAAVQISGRVLVLVDSGNGRLGFRKPADEAEEKQSFKVSTRAGRCAVNCTRAIQVLGLKSSFATGRYEIAVTGNLLTVNVRAGLQAALRGSGGGKVK